MTEKDTDFNLFDDIDGKDVTFDNSANPLSSDSGVALAAGLEKKFGIVKGLAEVWKDTRDAGKVVHSVFNMLLFRIFAIFAGYEDCNDLNKLKKDSIFKTALKLLPSSMKNLICQSTMSRLENSLEEKDVHKLLEYSIDLYCRFGYGSPPKSIFLDIDETICKTYGDQQGTLYSGYDNANGFRPIHINDIERGCVVAVKMRPARTLSGEEVLDIVPPVIESIRKYWPNTIINLRGDGHYTRPEFLSWCEQQKGVNFITGLGSNNRLANEPCVLEAIETCTKMCEEHRYRKVSKIAYCEFTYAAESWEGKERRVVAAVRVTKDNGVFRTKVRYIVTSLEKHNAKYLYTRVYCRRGQAENLIKEHKNYLKSDRMSCTSFKANQVRQVFHTIAHWYFVLLRDHIPNESNIKRSSIPTLQNRLIKVATISTESETNLHFAFSQSFPDYNLFKVILKKIRSNLPQIHQST